MTPDALTQLTAIIVFGIGAQWLAWRLNLPAILLLLFAGFLAGPVMESCGWTRLIDPDRLFGELLLPIVSLSVALVLFEGGLSLDLAELRAHGPVIWRLVTVGALVTWGVATLAAHGLLGMTWPLATLLGVILVVTGPTVIKPLLRHVRPADPVGPILKWEGIVIDPIGAMLAVLVFEAIPTSQTEAVETMLVGILKTLVVGGLMGWLAARLLVAALRRFWVPDFLHNPVTLMLLAAAFTLANHLQSESGLFAATLMGILIANQRKVPVMHILEFKETLSTLLVSALFIVLAARLTTSQISALGVYSVVFVLILVVFARPVAVLLSTVGSGLSWNERGFLAWMAPRGIVAASVASVFALRLRQAGYSGAEHLVPATFAAIVGTVLIYGLSASWVGRRLGMSGGNHGFLIVGANPLAQAIGESLLREGHPVLLVDSNPAPVRASRMSGLPVLYASILSQFVVDRLDLSGIGHLLALTANEELNSLATLRFARHFGRDHVYQLAPDTGDEGRKEKVAAELHGRVLFASGLTYEHLAQRLEQGSTIKRTPLTESFTFADFQNLYGESAVPLFVIDGTGKIQPVSTDLSLPPVPGQVVISLVGAGEMAATTPQNADSH